MDRRIKDVIETIERDLDKPVKISSLAAQVNLSVRRLEFLFIAEVGMNPKQYQVNHRLRLASQLLVDSHLRVSEVGYKVGFSDPSDFSKAFKKKFGVAPRAFRRQSFNSAT